jgi:primosomal replication protein N
MPEMINSRPPARSRRSHRHRRAQGCDLVINEEGRINGSPVNVRVTHFVLHHSTMPKEGRAWEGAVIYGDVMITGGPEREADQTGVSREMIAYFSSHKTRPVTTAGA